jgi:hypothetical protein
VSGEAPSGCAGPQAFKNFGGLADYESATVRTDSGKSNARVESGE